VECCWCGSTPTAEGIAQIFGFALRACISEGVLYMNCLYGSHFQHDRFDTLSFGEPGCVFDCSRTKVLPQATLTSSSVNWKSVSLFDL
jgi:hypothetical protein